MKVCRRCKNAKAYTDFTPKKENKIDGREATCRACRAEIKRNNYDPNRAKTTIAPKVDRPYKVGDPWFIF